LSRSAIKRYIEQEEKTLIIAEQGGGVCGTHLPLFLELELRYAPRYSCIAVQTYLLAGVHRQAYSVLRLFAFSAIQVVISMAQAFSIPKKNHKEK
jgi:hypothetical protein